MSQNGMALEFFLSAFRDRRGDSRRRSGILSTEKNTDGNIAEGSTDNDDHSESEEKKSQSVVDTNQVYKDVIMAAGEISPYNSHN